MRRQSLPRARATSRFVLLNEQHQRESVCRLADSHISDSVIASLTGLDLASVRRIIAERAIAKRTG